MSLFFLLDLNDIKGRANGKFKLRLVSRISDITPDKETQKSTISQTSSDLQGLQSIVDIIDYLNISH